MIGLLKKISNAKKLPEKYYALHFGEGVASYEATGQMLFISTDTAKKMDSTFVGKPVFVQHRPEYDLETIQEQADGWVVRSFYNPADGKHWAEILVVSDAGHEAIMNGWQVSNSYIVDETGPAGRWHDVPYDQEVLSASYDHLAIVDNPRYSESIVLTPEAFKKYNEEKQAELLKVANSKGDKPMFKFFNKSEEDKDQAAKLAKLSVQLPKSKAEMTLEKIINAMDELECKKGEKQYANADHFVKVGESEMTVNELMDKYKNLSDAEAERKAKAIKEGAEDLEDHEEEEEAEELEEELENKSESEEDDEEVENESEEDGKKPKKDNASEFDKLRKAHKTSNGGKKETFTIENDRTKLARGQSRYGSKK